MIDNETWELAMLFEGHKAILCKWMLRVKYLNSRELDKYNAKLVAKVFL